MRAGRYGDRVMAGARLAATLLVVLGVFGMHALSQHGLSHDAAANPIAAIAPAPSAGGHDHADHAAGDVPSGSPSGQTDTPQTDPVPDSAGGAVVTALDKDGPDGNVGDILMLCVAMLVAAFALIALFSRAGRASRAWAMGRRESTGALPARWMSPRGSGPPAVWQFSVIRC